MRPSRTIEFLNFQESAEILVRCIWDEPSEIHISSLDFANQGSRRRTDQYVQESKWILPAT